MSISNPDQFHCHGTMDPEVVKTSLDGMLPVFHAVDLAECKRLQEARHKMGICNSQEQYKERLRELWPSTKRPSALSNPNNLPLSVLLPNQFLPFMRQVEGLVVHEHLGAIVIYWSPIAAARLLPPGAAYRELQSNAFTCMFSEGRLDPPDEWCFLVESKRLCLAVFGNQLGKGR